MQKKTYNRTLLFFLGAIIASFWGVLGVSSGAMAYDCTLPFGTGSAPQTCDSVPVGTLIPSAAITINDGGSGYYNFTIDTSSLSGFYMNSHFGIYDSAGNRVQANNMEFDSPHTLVSQWQDYNSFFSTASAYLEDQHTVIYEISSNPYNRQFSYYFYYTWITAGLPPSVGPSMINAACGTDAGLTLDNAPTNLCSAGTADTSLTVIPYQGWLWTCHGSGGGTDAECQTYASTAVSFSPACGTANGTNFTGEMPSGSAACSIGTLSTPSGENTDGSYYWDCDLSPYAPVHCSTNAVYTVPTVTLDDCSSMTGIEYYGCTIWNGIQGMFVPSQEKLQEFQEVKNLMGNVFPFNYIGAAAGAIGSIHIETSDNLTINVNGTPYSLSAASLTGVPIIADVKLFGIFVVVLLFLGWCINYIKHFFK